MARPKKGTPEGDRASEQWRQTMIERYGENGPSIMMAKAGKQGGINGHTGGFASNRDLARKAGAMGGKRSKRGSSILPLYKKKHNEIARLHFKGESVREIARILDIPVSSLYRYIRQFID